MIVSWEVACWAVTTRIRRPTPYAAVQAGTASITLGPARVAAMRDNSNPACTKQYRIFRFCPLASAQHHEHMQVQPFAEKCLLALWQYQFYHQKFPLRGYYPAALAENGHAPFIVPIMQDLGKQIAPRRTEPQ